MNTDESCSVINSDHVQQYNLQRSTKLGNTQQCFLDNNKGTGRGVGLSDNTS